MPPGHLPRQVTQVCPPGENHKEDSFGVMLDYVTGLVWKHLRMLLKELDEVSREREVWDSLVGLLSPVSDKQEKMGRMDENDIISDLCN